MLGSTRATILSVFEILKSQVYFGLFPAPVGMCLLLML